MIFSPTWIKRLADRNPTRAGLAVLGWTDALEEAFTSTADGANRFPARVVRHDGVKVLVGDGESLEHLTFPRSLSLAVGDWVVVESGTVVERLDRSSVLERDIGDDGTQVIAANIDTVVVVFGVDRPLRRRKVLRFLAFAWDIGAEPLVVLSKVDLTEDIDAHIREIRSWGVDVPVLPVSVETNVGVEGVLDALAGRTGTFIGESGAGKSSLVNAMMRDEVASVGDVRSKDSKGRHTTSHRELHLLPGGGMVIDNPGVRALGLAGDSDGVEQLFSDIDELAAMCRFRDCSHRSEPGCAVVAAVRAGDIEASRLDAYVQFVAEQAGASDKEALKTRRTAKKQSAASAKRAAEGVDDRDL